MPTRLERFLQCEGGQAGLPACLLPGGKLRFLVETPSAVCAEVRRTSQDPRASYALDMQIRPDNSFYLYHGSGRAVEVTFDRKGEVAKILAADSFREAFPQCYDEVERSVRDARKDQFASALKGILTGIREKACQGNSRWSGVFWNGKEKYWQSRLSSRFGRQLVDAWEGGQWVFIDRECILSFHGRSKAERSEAKARFYAEIDAKYGAVIESFGETMAVSSKSTSGDNVDFLAIGPLGELLCVEVKHGSNASDIYWSVVQAAKYRDAFRKALPSISQDILIMVRQKVMLGILPEQVLERLPAAGGAFPYVESVVVVADPNLVSKEVWRRVSLIQERYPATGMPVFIACEKDGEVNMFPRQLRNYSVD